MIELAEENTVAEVKKVTCKHLFDDGGCYE